MFEELKREIEGLEGIINCKITGEKEIDEIHVLANQNRDPKKLVRDIETLVLVRLNSEIDHKKISIARIDETGEQSSENRVEIISIYQENNRPVFYFKLRINNNEIEEKFSGEMGEKQSVIIAKGMAETLQKYTSLREKIGVENVFISGMNNEIIVVQLVIYGKRGAHHDERLVGASYIDYNLPLAVGKAFLKALNRRLSEYL